MAIDIIYYPPRDEAAVKKTYHTVSSIQEELGRSRSWAYMVIGLYRPIYIQNAVTGLRERACHRNFVRRYLATHRRGNPNWI